jgi:serine/threonine-protein kinase RsbT
MADEVRVPIASDTDLLHARQAGRELAARVGFSSGDQTVIAAAISEIARNLLMYAGEGEIVIRAVGNGESSGVVIVARDRGPGIPDVEQALLDGYSTSGGFGVGLPGAKRLMDEFEIVSAKHQGTTVTMKKWKRNNGW